ncbi:MAG TPA: hypothetical protein VNB24_06860, partial [Acidimicrobiales bacterium]|nr:hypothetical protein [Acidimicrobiales bacterium]
MTAFACPSCGFDIDLFIPTPDGRTIWSDVPKLASIPFHSAVTLGDHSGTPVVQQDPFSPPALAFAGLAKTVEALLPT